MGFCSIFSVDPFSEAEARTLPLPPITITNTHFVGTSKGTRSIYTSWATPLCLGLVQFLRLATKEH